MTCTQPFNRRIGYGLSFIKLRVNEQAPPPQQKAPSQEAAQRLQFGPFRMLDKPDDDDLSVAAGSMFSMQQVMSLKFIHIYIKTV